MLAEYNLALFLCIKNTSSFDLTFFFDQDPKSVANLLCGKLSKPLSARWLWRNRPIELYLSFNFLMHIIKDRPSIVLSEDGGNILNNIFLVILKKLLGFKLILWGLGVIPNRTPSIYKRIAWPFIRFVWRHCDAIVSYSTFGKSVYIQNGVSSDRIFVAKNALDLGNVKERTLHYKSISSMRLKLKTKKVVLFIGRLEPTKRVEDLISAFKEISRDNPNILLFIVGDGSSRFLLESIVVSERIKNCYFEGGRDIYSASEFFAFADVCVVPGEGGLVINHSLMHGVPVIVSTADGTENDLIKDGMNGFFFTKGDVPNLTIKIRKLLKSKRYRNYCQMHTNDVPTIKQMAISFEKSFNFTATYSKPFIVK